MPCWTKLSKLVRSLGHLLKTHSSRSQERKTLNLNFFTRLYSSHFTLMKCLSARKMKSRLSWCTCSLQVSKSPMKQWSLSLKLVRVFRTTPVKFNKTWVKLSSLNLVIIWKNMARGSERFKCCLSQKTLVNLSKACKR